MKPMRCNIDICFSDSESRLFGDLTDKLSIDVGDYSPSRLEAFKQELCGRLDKAWQYMASRGNPPAMAHAPVAVTVPPSDDYAEYDDEEE